MSNSIEDSIDKAARILGAESLANFDRLIDGHLRRDVVAIQKLVNRYSKDVSINPIHTTHLPMLSICLNEITDFIPVLDHTMDQALAEFPRLLVSGEIRPKEFKGFTHISSSHIDLVKNLEGEFPPLSPSSQRSPDILKSVK